MKRNTRIQPLPAVLVLFGALAGCLDDRLPGDPPEPDGDEAMISQTIVMLHADGTRTEYSVQISRAEQRAQAEARLARENGLPTSNVAEEDEQKLTQTSCADLAALWLYRGENGTGDMLCIKRDNLKSGTDEYFNLRDYCYRWSGTTCAETWRFHVNSFWPGESGGALLGFQCEKRFTVWGPRTNVRSGNRNPLDHCDDQRPLPDPGVDLTVPDRGYLAP